MFDIGGVLVNLTGVTTMMMWLGDGVDEDEVWKRWLRSDAVRQFETGKFDPDVFAERIVREQGLPASPQEFLGRFSVWPESVYRGGHDLLGSLSADHRLACLSNTNGLHWARIAGEMGLARHFERVFLSHETGLMKPDLEAFEHAARSLAVAAENILYLDDNQACVDAARAIGMDAHRAVGLEGVVAVLEREGIIRSS